MIVIKTSVGLYFEPKGMKLHEFIRQYQIGGVWALSPKEAGDLKVIHHVPWGAVLAVFEVPSP